MRRCYLWMSLLLAGAMTQGGCVDIGARLGGLLGAQQGALFYAHDVLAVPGETVNLTAQLQRSNFVDIEQVSIGFYDEDGHLLGSAMTERDGRARLDWRVGPAGDYRLTARIMGCRVARAHDYQHIQAAPLLVAVRDRNTPIAIIDLDYTVVDGSAWDAMRGNPDAMPGSIEVTRRIAQRYSLVYLTYRPDPLMNKTKDWLALHGFPRGPLLVSTLEAVIWKDSGEVKARRMAEIRRSFPNLKIGIGDKVSDVRAYVDNGMVAYLIPHYDDAEQMRDLCSQIRGLPDSGRVQVVRDWEQLEQGIFNGAIFPPRSYADWLEQQARDLEARRK